MEASGQKLFRYEKYVEWQNKLYHSIPQVKIYISMYFLLFFDVVFIMISLLHFSDVRDRIRELIFIRSLQLFERPNLIT
jgi:hypothetical protein